MRIPRRVMVAGVAVTIAGGVIVAALAGIGGGTRVPTAGTKAGGLPRGALAPAFTVQAAHEPVGERLLHGKQLVLLFVRPSCRPCAADLRSVDAVAPKLVGPGGEHTLYLAVDGPGGGGWSALTAYARSLGITAGLMYAGDPNGTAARLFRVQSPGTVVVIGADRRIAWTGLHPSPAALRTALARLAG